MGGACCVTARDKNIVSGPGGDILHRNIRHSPSWSFRWDNRGRVAGEDTSISWFSGGISRNYGPDIKYESSYASEDGSPTESFQRRMWHKSPTSEGAAAHARTPTSDQSISRNISMDTSLEQVESTESTAVLNLSPAKFSFSLPSTSSMSTSPLPSPSHFHPASSTPRWLQHSPKHQLLKPVSDAPIPGMKSSKSIPQWITQGCHGESSDGWSMHAFSELMATSNRERWSCDNECLGFNHKKTRSSGRNSAFPLVDLQTCGVCSKQLTEKSLWSSQKLIASNELSVVAVLTCGHVYHAECLEVLTPEIDKYDPACPFCILGEKQAFKLSQKALKTEMDLKARNKKLRSRVVDSDLDGDSIMKGSQDGSSASMKSSLAKPFPRRHFSFGSKGSGSSTETHSTKKKGFFWTRSLRG
ncbi:cell wall protein [Salix suchowensis]|nr:cell wall protein [Salix suchowensis]